ncbi:hypothetical protein [Acanthopleuribacter pedis]|uniref:Uncharacterized protein n=1 Tax=Acanthopleuribacter pedis TaxID=442870 RepID=A0A8J7U4B4_9BACT|nr:hypothetical protein [Acanthopleuribacter pedis]MBO1321318.1 hypothetical protein [Acanthopleuribacter pedis]
MNDPMNQGTTNPYQGNRRAFGQTALTDMLDRMLLGVAASFVPSVFVVGVVFSGLVEDADGPGFFSGFLMIVMMGVFHAGAMVLARFFGCKRLVKGLLFGPVILVPAFSVLLGLIFFLN